jgi:hypothetical protein
VSNARRTKVGTPFLPARMSYQSPALYILYTHMIRLRRKVMAKARLAAKQDARKKQ